MTGISTDNIKKAVDLLDFRFLKFNIANCPLHGRSVFIRLNNTMLGVRCLVCGAAPIATSMAKVLIKYEPDFKNKKVYELSSRGAYFEFLKKNVEKLTYSEYIDDVSPGAVENGILCQDVQKLTFDSALFDICTSTEVFEHVPDDIRGFKEVFRVLKNQGSFIFTVPLSEKSKTIERARVDGDDIIHLLPPEYHDDSIRGAGKVLVFRDYGSDIVDRLLEVGFSQVDILQEYDCAGFGYSKKVVVARKNVN